ncbi:MAG: hypothetical protein IBX36_00770 [Dehalococcoidia bacterium]|nr:hypothetical protein [Dehalococcoidia bacterium]
MAKWLVRLKGEKFDLEDLPRLLHSPELAVSEENGFYYLQSSEFESLTSSDEVRKRGIDLIDKLNGAAKLYRGNFQDVSEDGITHVEDDGRCHRYVYLEGTVTGRGKLRANATVISPDGTEKKVDQPTNLETWIGIANKYKPVADALHFFRQHSWVNLYKVYEIIRDDVGGENAIIAQHRVSKGKLKRFKQTAQSRAALGDYARHASKKYKPPAQLMSLSEAKSMIKDILINWMQTKT